ncbi:hypothetical protein JCM21714_2116 [Gracilibacillus boraciitolerans JCM 21714]|uniref:Uncharacterized protein n=1 Tax=Gracilibacillus boraciitolerans JCM 21714 TaxID=1298598 RepID=W4VJY6_9BACI|nr:hypothetical protein JCM21714_2116 [Gracilibacillus boraciitolerans JCM 21714]
MYRYEGFVTKPTSDTRVYRYQGWVYAVVNNPTNSGQASSTGNGKASGQFIWQLNKQNANAPSRVQLRNTAGIAGSHFATRNSIYQINSPSVISKTSTAPQNYYVNDPHDLRDKNINYAFAYDYTNYYRDVYTCSSSRSDGCIQWTYSHREPDWTYQETATFNKTMKGDHKYQDQQEIVYPTNNISLIVGRTTNLSNMNESYQQEHFNVDNSTITKETQTWIEINEPVTYRSDLGNPLYSLTDELWYFPNEIDENLEEQYKNTTSFTYSDIAIPLRVNMKNNSSINYKTEDNFFVTKNNGLLFSLPHTQVSILAINKKAKEEYEDFTGETYEDEVLNSPFNGSRYYFNINGNSEQEPNIQYSNDYIVGELGLSDATLHIGENLEFEKYLLGNPIDDPVINEQPGSKVLNANYDNSITIKSNQISDLKDISNDRNFLIHGFRSTDIYKKYNQVKNILPSLSY